MRHTTLLLALAALAATSCSLQLDSQYGLRWDRRIPTNRNDDFKIPNSNISLEREPQVVQYEQHATDNELQVGISTIETASYPNTVLNREYEQAPDPLHFVHESLNTNFVDTVKTNSNAPIQAPVQTAQEINGLILNGLIPLLKVMGTLILVGVAVYLAFIGIIIALFTDWSDWSFGGGGGGGSGVGSIGLPSFGFWDGLFSVLATSFGIWLCIKIIKKMWTKGQKS
jgi:hypothetical protein